MKKALFITEQFERIYHPDDYAEIAKLVDIYAPLQNKDILQTNPELLADMEILFSGWETAKMDAAFLEATPKLKAVFYGAGSVRRVTSEAFWQRDIVITNAVYPNSIPVAEYTFAQIIMCLKQCYKAAHLMRNKRDVFPDNIDPKTGKVVTDIDSYKSSYELKMYKLLGVYNTTVGIISLGVISRILLDFLKLIDVNVLVYSSHLTDAQAAELGVRRADSLEEVFTNSDVVSLHSPWREDTENMITARHFAMMKENAAFINTARGAVVNEPEMIQALKKRPDLYAVLDVTHPRPPLPDSPIWDLENALITPHLAGSMGNECFRMGHTMLEELQRYLNNEPLKWQVTRQKAEYMA